MGQVIINRNGSAMVVNTGNKLTPASTDTNYDTLVDKIVAGENETPVNIGAASTMLTAIESQFASDTHTPLVETPSEIIDDQMEK